MAKREREFEETQKCKIAKTDEFQTPYTRRGQLKTDYLEESKLKIEKENQWYLNQAILRTNVRFENECP